MHYLKKQYSYILFVLPAFLVYTIITIIPTLYAFFYSFTDYNGLAPKYNFVGLHNFLKVFTTGNVLETLKNSLVFGFISPIVITILAVPLALVLNSYMKTRNLLRAIFFFPSVISALFLGYIWGYVLSPSDSGLVNSLLIHLGLPKALLLADAQHVMLYLLLVNAWCVTGWHACIYLANLQVVPADYYEAATIDGAGFLEKFKNITLPMLAPSFTVSVMLLLTGSLKVFDLPFALTRGGPGYASTMITQTIITEGINSNQVGFASAMSVMFFIIISIVTVFQVKIMRAREDKLV